MSGTPSPTWNNPVRSISRTSSAASTVSSVADDSIAGSEKPPVDSVSTTTATATATTPNNDHRKDDKDSPGKTERAQQQQQQQHQENVSNMVFPLTAAARTLSVAASSNITSSSNFLNGKLVLVTGGSGTIGMAIATALVKHKASVVLTGRNVNRLETAVEKIREACPEAPENSVKLVSCDVSKEDSVEKLFNTLDVYKDKRVDILINNAGMNITGETENLTAHDFESVMAVNVLGPFLCSREVMKRMKSSGLGGRIINIGSLSAHCARPDSAPYTTSKFALRGLTESLALDGRPHNIAVGMIHPGNVQSELLTPEQIQERQHEGFLLPEQVADCVAHMCSLPYCVNIQEMTVLPTAQPFVGRG